MGNGMNHLREFCGFRLDGERLVLWHGNEPVPVPPKEIELLSALVERSNQVVSKDELMDRVWANSIVEESNISRHIYRLRKMFVEHGLPADLIQTVPRRGYRFTGDIDQGNGDIVIERHSITRTLVEKLDNSIQPNANELSETRSLSRSVSIATVAVIVFMTSAFGYYLFNRTDAARPSVRSVAVLPLVYSELNGNNAISLGLTDSLTADLGTADELRVVSPRAVARSLGPDKEPLEIGRELGVDAIINGTIRKADNSLQVTLVLSRISDGKPIWSESFDGKETGIFELRNAIALKTANALSVDIKPEVLAKRSTDNVRAYELYAQGMQLFRLRQTSRAGELFTAATDLDPNFAKAWAGLAGVYAMGDNMAKAEATATRALDLDPYLADAHAVRGFVKMFLEWDWNTAEGALDRAVELDRNSVEAHHWRGTLHQIRGRLDLAKADLNRALELDPTSANLMSDLGYIHFFAGEFDRAEELYNSVALSEPDLVFGRRYLLYQIQGRADDAFAASLYICTRLKTVEETQKCRERYQDQYANGGLSNMARVTISSLETNSRTGALPAHIWHDIAINYAQLGEKRKAADSLLRALESKKGFEMASFTLPFSSTLPTFAALRNEPQYQEFVRRMKLN